MELRDRIVLVSGGGRGIGRAIARAFAGQGAQVAVLARSAAEVDNVAAELQKVGSRAVSVPCDITDRQAVENAVQRIHDDLGPVEILVNNAGVGNERRKVGDDDPENWRRIIDVNVTGTYQLTRAVLPHMRKRQRGRIIIVGSGMGHQSRSGNSSYNTAKAALWMLTRCLAEELWNENIAVNELIPGPVYTEMTADVFEEARPHPVIPSEWVKSPEDVTSLALFLATQPDHGPTGQSFSLARRPL